MLDVAIGILVPFIGTSVGAAFALTVGRNFAERTNGFLSGFASGVMIAASVWSLIIPCIEMSSQYGIFAFVPALVGFLCGILMVIILDAILADKLGVSHKRNLLLFLSVTLHNIPEGMAIGAAYAALIFGGETFSLMQAVALSLGIAIQNIPEGAIIALPLKGEGMSRLKSAGFGVLSGVVEPVASVLTILLVRFAVPILPYLLSFAAGTMVCVVIEELLPQAQKSTINKCGILSFALGFSVMMCLDVAL